MVGVTSPVKLGGIYIIICNCGELWTFFWHTYMLLCISIRVDIKSSLLMCIISAHNQPPLKVVNVLYCHEDNNVMLMEDLKTQGFSLIHDNRPHLRNALTKEQVKRHSTIISYPMLHKIGFKRTLMRTRVFAAPVNVEWGHITHSYAMWTNAFLPFRTSR